jgi:hypothetical protein
MRFSWGLKNSRPVAISQSHRPSAASLRANHSWFSRLCMSFSRAIRRRTSRATDKELAPIEAEMGGVHLDVDLVPSRWRCRPTKVKPPATDRRRDLRPLGHARQLRSSCRLSTLW